MVALSVNLKDLLHVLGAPPVASPLTVHLCQRLQAPQVHLILLRGEGVLAVAHLEEDAIDKVSADLRSAERDPEANLEVVEVDERECPAVDVAVGGSEDEASLDGSEGDGHGLRIEGERGEGQHELELAMSRRRTHGGLSEELVRLGSEAGAESVDVVAAVRRRVRSATRSGSYRGPSILTQPPCWKVWRKRSIGKRDRLVRPWKRPMEAADELRPVVVRAGASEAMRGKVLVVFVVGSGLGPALAAVVEDAPNDLWAQGVALGQLAGARRKDREAAGGPLDDNLGALAGVLDVRIDGRDVSGADDCVEPAALEAGVGTEESAESVLIESGELQVLGALEEAEKIVKVRQPGGGEGMVEQAADANRQNSFAKNSRNWA